MKILIIGMADSVHLAKWLRQFKGSVHSFEIVSSSPHRKVHPILKQLVSEGPQFSISWFSRFLSLPLWIADRLLDDWLRGTLIAWRSAVFKPDAVHVLEFQNGGYSYLKARMLTTRLDVPLLLTPYGSDIFWFQNYRSHLERIKRLLKAATAISSECLRDEKLATKYGFTGVFAPRIPASGSIQLNETRFANDKRFRIAIKGYQNKWGQALIALDCVAEMASELKDFEITLFSCNRVTIRSAKRLAERTGLKVTAHPKGALSNDDVNLLLSESIALIALSTSDGVPASMLEAMANGAIPIQSDTSCCNEWLTSGAGGFLLPWNDKEAVKDRLRFILANKAFRDEAAAVNINTLRGAANFEASSRAASTAYDILERSL